jgi:hypothetical protein
MGDDTGTDPEPTGAERYLADRLRDPKYRAAYAAFRSQFPLPDTADDTGTDWAALADRLGAEQGHPDGGDIALSDLRAAAVGLRRLAQLDTAIGQQIAELRAIHRPQWASPDGGYTTERRDGYTPVGCAECYPHDGSWPCITAMVADDLAAAVLGSGEQPERTEP